MEQLREFLKSGAPFRRFRRAPAPELAASGALAAPGEWSLNRPPAAPVFRVRFASREDLEAAQADWRRLAAQALETSPFADPDFLLSAARHLTFESRPRFVVVHDAAGRLVAVFPLAPAALMTAGGFLRLWSVDPGAAVPPLIDRDRAEEVLAAFLDWAGAQGLPAGVLFRGLPLGGALHQLLSPGRRLVVFDASIPPTLCGEVEGWETNGSAALILSSAPADIREAVERFLTLDALERRAAGRAPAIDAAEATFLRSATRLLSAQGRCRAVALDCAGRPLAIALLVEGDGPSALWRLAADVKTCPSARRRLLDGLAQLQFTRSEIAPPAPSWSNLRVADIAVSLRAGFEAACRRERNRRRWRALAARAARRLTSSREE